MIIKQGQTVTFETGEYSDFTYIGPFKVLKDFDQQEVVNKFKEENPPVETEYGEWGKKYYGRDTYMKPMATEDNFVPWLVRNGYVEDQEDNFQWYIGAYGSFDPQII